jgi:hypothetical protein
VVAEATAEPRDGTLVERCRRERVELVGGPGRGCTSREADPDPDAGGAPEPLSSCEHLSLRFGATHA